MVLVGKLTEEQKDFLIGPPRQLVANDNWYFNPIQDGTDEKNWIISQEEMDASEYQQNNFVKNLPLIEYVPQIIDPDPIF